MNIAFLVSYLRTVQFHAVATRLERQGHRVSWISPSRHWRRWLQGQGVPAERIYDLTAHASAWKDPAAPRVDLAELAPLEGPISLRDLVLMDRLLRRRPPHEAVSYLATHARALAPFLRAQGVEAVFGEQTHAFDLVTARVCEQLGVPLFAPHTVRIPSLRFGFFRGFTQAELAPSRAPTDADRDAAQRLLAEFRDRPPRPFYFAANARVPRPRLDWLPKVSKHLRLAWEDRDDQTRPSLAILGRTRLAESARAALTAWTRPFAVAPLPAKRPFVLLTLHKQPEASIDVLGPRTSNQLELARHVARALPATHDLYVKEHSNAIGDRGPAFYGALAAIPGVVLVDPYQSSFELMKHAALVLTVSGTIGFEAGLLGIPAATFARMFFEPVLLRSGLSAEALTTPALTELLEEGRRWPATDHDERAVAFLAGLLAQSFEGNVSGPQASADTMAPANLDHIAHGFLTLLATLERSAPGAEAAR